MSGSAVHKAPLQEEEIKAICHGTLMVSHKIFPSLSSLSKLRNSTSCYAMATVHFASSDFLYLTLTLYCRGYPTCTLTTVSIETLRLETSSLLRKGVSN